MSTAPQIESVRYGLIPAHGGRAGVVRIQRLPHQREFLDFRRMDWKVALVAALGQGKTWALCMKAYQMARINAPLGGLLVVPTYPLFRMVHLAEWPDLLWDKLRVRLLWRAQDSAFVWPWGGKLWVRTAEKPNRIAGPNLAYLLGDEPGQWSEDAFLRAIGRIRHPDAKMRLSAFAGTPEGLNFFADQFADPDPKKKRATVWGRSWHPALAHYPAELRDLYGHDPSLLAAYAKGQFVPLRQGLVFGAFSRAKHVQRTEYQECLPLVLACDFNVDAMRWGVGQVSPHEITILDEIALGRDATTERAAVEFVRRWGHHRGELIVCGDAAGKARRTNASKTDYQVLTEELRKGQFYRIKVLTPASNPSVKDTADMVCYHLAGRGRDVAIDPKAKELILDLERVAWKPGIPEFDKSDPLRTHSADWLRYIVHTLARPTAGRRWTIGGVHAS